MPRITVIPALAEEPFTAYTLKPQHDSLRERVRSLLTGSDGSVTLSYEDVARIENRTNIYDRWGDVVSLHDMADAADHHNTVERAWRSIARWKRNETNHMLKEMTRDVLHAKEYLRARKTVNVLRTRHYESVREMA